MTKGSKMQIRTRVQNGETTVELVHPDGNRVCDSRTLSEGQQVVFQATDVHEEGGIEVGEVTQVASDETEVAPDANPDREPEQTPAVGGAQPGYPGTPETDGDDSGEDNE